MTLPYSEYYNCITAEMFTVNDGSGHSFRVFNTQVQDGSNYFYKAYLQEKSWSQNWEATLWSSAVELPGSSYTYPGFGINLRWYLLALTCSPDGTLSMLYARRITRNTTYIGVFLREKPKGGSWGNEFEVISQDSGFGAYDSIIIEDWIFNWSNFTRMQRLPTGLYIWISNGTMVQRDIYGAWLPIKDLSNSIDPVNEYLVESSFILSPVRYGEEKALFNVGRAPQWSAALEYEERDGQGGWNPRVRYHGDYVQPDYTNWPVALSDTQHLSNIPTIGFSVACCGFNYWGDSNSVLTVVTSDDISFAPVAGVTALPLQVHNTIAQLLKLRYGGTDLGDFSIEGLDLNTSEGYVLRRVECINTGTVDLGGVKLTAACSVGTISVAVELPGDTMEEAIGRGMDTTLHSPPVPASGSFFFWLKWQAPTPKVYGTNTVTLTLDVS